MSVSLRGMKQADIPTCKRLSNQVGWNQTAADWARLIAWEPLGCFVAEQAGEVVATVTTTTYESRLAWVGMMLVDTTLRRQGIGRMLLAEALGAARVGIRAWRPPIEMPTFADATRSAGIDFRHRQHFLLEPAQAGAAFFDYEGDGRPDIFLTNGSGPNALYRNNGDGTFADVTAKADLAVNACTAGKHVFCEKPLSMTLEEARRVQRAVHESGVKLMSGWWFKHSPVTKRLREVIQRPYFVLFTCRLSSPAHRHPDDDEGPYGRDGILDAAGYNLHWIWHVMRSQPVEVYAMGFEGRPTNTSTISIRFENGGIGDSIYSVLGTGGILPKQYAEVHAGPVSAATLRFGNLAFEGTDEPGIEGNRYHNGFDEEMSMFAHLCLEGGTNPMDAWESCIPTLIFEKAVESMRSGRPVSLNVVEEFYLPGGKLPPSIENFGDG